MIIPSIDIMKGQTVQLIGGKTMALEAGDPRPIASRFGRVGEIAVVDLDAALGHGNNRVLVESLLSRASCRVGGGIRDLKQALDWLDKGATKIVIGTAATPEFLAKLPKERVIAALDARHGKVTTQGWTKQSDTRVLDAIKNLRFLVSGFLVTIVEREGQLSGVDFELARALRDACGPARLTLAGGVATADEVANLDRLGIDAQVGMALYTKKFCLADCLGAMLQSDRDDGLWPTVVADEQGLALGLAYSDAESLQRTLASGDVHYRSRSGRLWRKGASSGNTQRLLRVDMDCDRDTLRFTVQQRGQGFCHLETRSCFGAADRGLGALMRRIQKQIAVAPEGSYTRRLFEDPALLGSKIREEARELSEADGAAHVTQEAADLIYFTLTRAAASGCELAGIEAELDRRALRVRRRSQDSREKSAHERGRETP